METYRRTLYGGTLQTAQLLGLPYTPAPNTTLNEKLSIQNGTPLNPNEMPSMRYITIGIGGHKGTTGADGIPLITNLQHDATHAASYRMLPFVVRALDADLTSTEMSKYCLRRIETHNGIECAVYYGRRIDMSGVMPVTKKKIVFQGTETVSDFVPTNEVLSPTPPLSLPGANVVDGTYVYTTAQVTIDFDAFDATEILNAANVIYGDEQYAFISEFTFVTGVDRTVQAPSVAGNSITMEEVIGAQVFCHVSAMQPMFSQRNGFQATYDVGVSEPMMIFTGP